MCYSSKHGDEPMLHTLSRDWKCLGPTVSRDTCGTPPWPRAGAQEQEQQDDTVVPQGLGTRQHRARLRTHVMHDTNTEHDFPVGGSINDSLPQPPIWFFPHTGTSVGTSRA